MYHLAIDAAGVQPPFGSGLFVGEVRLTQGFVGCVDERTAGYVEIDLKTGTARVIAAVAPFTPTALEKIFGALDPGWDRPWS
jgi:hypothetical protein